MDRQMGQKILIASGNQGKIIEIRDFFKELQLEIVGLESFPGLPEVVEDGETFRDNALKKARIRALATGLLTLADDSGLEVDALEGAPGIYSARFAGMEADDEDNNHKLLQEIKDILPEQRTARYRIVMALVDPEKNREITVEGVCEGSIVTTRRGENGFGYDPYFFLPEYGKTMAELPLEVKNQISHRAIALKKMREVIIDRYPVL